MIRTGQPRARVAGIFDVRDQPAVRQLLEPGGFDMEDGELLIEREILAGGKSRAFVGSRPVSAALLKDLAPHLADIHGQHDQQLLFSSDAQREMLDAFAGHRELLDHAGGVYTEWRQTGAGLEELERSEQEKLRLLDLWSFQRKEIEAAGLQEGEEAFLENERRVLQNVQRLQEAAETAWAAVYDSPESALSLTRIAGKRIEELCRIDSSLEALREQVKAADLSLQEVAYGLRDYIGGLEANPGRLEEVEARLAAIDKLKRKYGQSIPEILAFLADVRGKIETLEHAGERMEALRNCRRGWRRRMERPPPNSAGAAPPRHANWKSASKPNWRNWPWSAPSSASGSPRPNGPRTASIAWTSWFHPTWARSRARSRKSPPVAKSRASRWR